MFVFLVFFGGFPGIPWAMRFTEKAESDFMGCHFIFSVFFLSHQSLLYVLFWGMGNGYLWLSVLFSGRRHGRVPLRKHGTFRG